MPATHRFPPLTGLGGGQLIRTIALKTLSSFGGGQSIGERCFQTLLEFLSRNDVLILRQIRIPDKSIVVSTMGRKSRDMTTTGVDEEPFRFLSLNRPFCGFSCPLSSFGAHHQPWCLPQQTRFEERSPFLPHLLQILLGYLCPFHHQRRFYESGASTGCEDGSIKAREGNWGVGKTGMAHD